MLPTVLVATPFAAPAAADYTFAGAFDDVTNGTGETTRYRVTRLLAVHALRPWKSENERGGEQHTLRGRYVRRQTLGNNIGCRCASHARCPSSPFAVGNVTRTQFERAGCGRATCVRGLHVHNDFSPSVPWPVPRKRAVLVQAVRGPKQQF